MVSEVMPRVFVIFGIERAVDERPCAEEGVSLDEAKRYLEERYGL